MNRIMQISHEFVEFIPEQLEQGVIYVSRRYSTASHLCCCGCGLKAVTPLNAAGSGSSQNETEPSRFTLRSGIGAFPASRTTGLMEAVSDGVRQCYDPRSLA